jgi:D-alanine transaminase
MQELVYLNGKFTPKDQAQISPFDRGFLFGDAIYEGVPIYNQQAFLLESHYQRLTNNLAAIGIKQPLSLTKFTAIAATLATQAKTPENYGVYYQVSRGNHFNRSHLYPESMQPTVFACLQPTTAASFLNYSQGYNAATALDLRWHCPHIKATSLLANILHLQTSTAQCSKETLLYDPNNNFTEGCSSNVFFVKNGTILTPPTAAKILPGITRAHVSKLAKPLDIVIQETNCNLDLLSTCDEVFITGAYKEIMPIVQVDQTVIGSGKPGPIWKKLFQAYKASIAANLVDLKKCQTTIPS